MLVLNFSTCYLNIPHKNKWLKNVDVLLKATFRFICFYFYATTRHSSMAAFIFFKLSILLSLLSNSHFGVWSETKQSKGISPPSCSRIECPSYDVIHVGNGYEIRRYNSTVWTSTSPIQDISLVEATRNGFLQ